MLSSSSSKSGNKFGVYTNVPGIPTLLSCSVLSLFSLYTMRAVYGKESLLLLLCVGLRTKFLLLLGLLSSLASSRAGCRYRRIDTVSVVGIYDYVIINTFVKILSVQNS